MFHPNGPTLYELAVQALSSTDRGYDLLAPKFELTPFRTPDEVLQVAAQAIDERSGPQKVLDLCCGTGAGLRHARTRTNVAMAVGVDRSAGMLAEGRKLLELDERGGAARLAPFALLRGDALALPFQHAFDVVTCFGAFGHILEADEPRLVREVARALKPGGRFLFVTGDEPRPWRPAYWVARGFNAVMRVRNALRKPEFVMYYLTFLVPRATALLEAERFSVEVRRGVFPRPYQRLALLVATAPTTVGP